MIDEFLSQPTKDVLETIDRQRGPFLVLGAGGKMGLHLCSMIRLGLRELGRGDRVIAVSRFGALRDRDSFERREIETLASDLAEASNIEKLPDAPIVFFLAGTKFGTSNAPDLLRRMNVEMPQNVAKRFPSSRIVAFSSGCVYPFVTPASGGATEATDLEAIGEYAASCIDREKAFQASSRRNGNPIAIIRLNYAIEFRYGILLDIGQKILRDEPIDLTTGYVNLIWQRDAVAMTIRTLEFADSPAIPLNVTGREIHSVRDLATRLGTALQHRVSFVGKEEPTAWLSNPSLSYEKLGPPETSLDEMISWVAAWLGNHGKTWKKPTGYDRRDGKF